MKLPVRQCFIVKIDGVTYTKLNLAEVNTLIRRYMEDGDEFTFTLKRVRP